MSETMKSQNLRKKIKTQENLQINYDKIDLQTEAVPESVTLDYQEGWEDSHDEEIDIDLSKVNSRRKFIKGNQNIVSGKEYSKRLREFYDQRIQNTSFLKWATEKQEVNLEIGEQKQQSLSELLAMPIENKTQKATISRPGILDIKKIGYVRHEDKADAVVKTIAFHKRLPIFLTGAFDKVLRIYQIRETHKDFDDNINLLKTIHLEKFPISCAAFMNNSDRIIASSFKHNFLVVFDYLLNKKTIIQSKFMASESQAKTKNSNKIQFCIHEDDQYVAVFNESGYITVLNGQNFSFLFEFKQNEPCLSACFFQDYLLTAGSTGKVLNYLYKNQIYQWSLENKIIKNVFVCPGGIQINSISAGMNKMAIGSSTGVVSIFEFDKIQQKFKKDPIKVLYNQFQTIKEIKNLQTSISQIQFDPSGELLCLMSKWKLNAVRIFQVDTMMTVQNWPNLKTNLKMINTFCFSYDSKYLVFGNEIGEIIIYKLS